MAHGQASERLRELQELMDADNQALARDLDAGPSDTSPEPHSSPFRVSQSGGPRSWKERLQALKVYLPTEPRSWAIIAGATVASIVLLWLLFGADIGQKYIAPVLPYATSRPLSYTELKAKHPENPCPESWWFDEICLTTERSKSQTVYERCGAEFQELGYTIEILDDCGLLKP